MNKDEEKKLEDEKVDETPEKKDDSSPETPEEQPKQKEKKSEPEKKDKTEEKKPETKPEPEPEQQKKPPDKNNGDSKELDDLRAENMRLTTQLEAIKAGFSPDLTEEAVLLAEHIAAKEGCDIKAALGKVAEKFPEWKKTTEERKEKKKGGIKVGAPTGDKPSEKKPLPTSVKRWNRFNSI